MEKFLIPVTATNRNDIDNISLYQITAICKDGDKTKVFIGGLTEYLLVTSPSYSWFHSHVIDEPLV